MWVAASLRQDARGSGGANLFLHAHIDLGMNGAARLL